MTHEPSYCTRSSIRVVSNEMTAMMFWTIHLAKRLSQVLVDIFSNCSRKLTKYSIPMQIQV